LRGLAEYLTDGTTETTTYDPFGNLAAVSNPNVTCTFGYDNKNRLTTKIDSRSNKSLVLTYDRVGNLERPAAAGEGGCRASHA
jgi:YD repeat-containing protein